MDLVPSHTLTLIGGPFPAREIPTASFDQSAQQPQAAKPVAWTAAKLPTAPKPCTAPEPEASSAYHVSSEALASALEGKVGQTAGQTDSSLPQLKVSSTNEQHRLSPAGADTPQFGEAEQLNTPTTNAFTPAATLEGAPAALSSPMRRLRMDSAHTSGHQKAAVINSNATKEQAASSVEHVTAQPGVDDISELASLSTNPAVAAASIEEAAKAAQQPLITASLAGAPALLSSSVRHFPKITHVYSRRHKKAAVISSNAPKEQAASSIQQGLFEAAQLDMPGASQQAPSCTGPAIASASTDQAAQAASETLGSLQVNAACVLRLSWYLTTAVRVINSCYLAW